MIPRRSEASTPIAAIDIGTNSIHMVIAREVPNGTPELLAREKMRVRLGSGGADMDRLLPDAIDRAIEALIEMRHIADVHDAEIAAIATSAVREARNQHEFLRRAKDEAEITVEVVSGVEEARLIHLGAMSAVPIAGKPHLVIDIGGGSTEVILGDGVSPDYARSVKLGHIRLTDRFFPNGVVRSGAAKACRRHIKSFIAPIRQQAQRLGFEVAVGSSGTIESVALMCAAHRGEPLRSAANATITRSELKTIETSLITRVHPTERVHIEGLDPNRSDVIVGGVVLLRQLFKSLNIKSMVVSNAALREGVLLDRLNLRERSNGDGLHHLNDLRRLSAIALASNYQEDLNHAEHATDLALELFDETRVVHGLGSEDSEMLEAAGLLHNIGRFVAESKHHKHSYYLIRNSERLAGFTEGELELIALVARYHRKASPKRKHTEYMALSPKNRYRVRVLAGLLRVGIALDRTYRQAVRQIHALTDDDKVQVAVEVSPGTDVSIEHFTASRSRDLLEDALGRSVDFHVVEIDNLTPGNWRPTRNFN